MHPYRAVALSRGTTTTGDIGPRGLVPSSLTAWRKWQIGGRRPKTWARTRKRRRCKALFAKASAFSTKKQIPIILGEFAVTTGKGSPENSGKFPREPASRTLWMTSVAKASKTNGIVPVLWDTGSEISRADGAFSTEFQAAFDSLSSGHPHVRSVAEGVRALPVWGARCDS